MPTTMPPEAEAGAKGGGAVPEAEAAAGAAAAAAAAPGVAGAGGAAAGTAAAGAAPPATSTGGTDVCGTPEEEQKKLLFSLQLHTALNFRPSAGYGIFDAYYLPIASYMAAFVKMSFNFLEAENTPDPITLISMWANGDDISQFFWTESEKRQYAVDYQQSVANTWSYQHTFRSTKPCWDFAVSPIISPLIVDDPSGAHYKVDVFKLNTWNGATGQRTSEFSARNPGTPGWQGTGELDSEDTKVMNDRFSTSVARSERQRIERAIAAQIATPIQFAQGSDVVSAADRTRLEALADLLKQKNPSDPDIPILCTGLASAEGKATDNQTLSERRADAVALILTGAGISQPTFASGSGAVGAADDASNRRVDIAADRSFETSYTDNDFKPDAHEFGHAIGLPDEYSNHTTGQLGTKQQAFVTLAQAAGVSPPDRWGDHTSSVMSVGVDVLPRHYSTMWEALGSMTTPDIAQNQWAID